MRTETSRALNAVSTRKARIESLWAAGKPLPEIVRIVGCNENYAAKVIATLFGSTIADQAPVTDCAHHLLKIKRAHGSGFPFYPAVPL